MRLRDLLGSGLFLAVAVVHFCFQWYGWKLHMGEIAAAERWVQGDVLWSVCSFPLFALLPRRIQTLYFLQTLLANSALWGAALSWSSYAVLRRLQRGQPVYHRPRRAPGRPAQPTAPERTRVDRLVELKRMRDQGLISAEEYLEQRATILTEV